MYIRPGKSLRCSSTSASSSAISVAGMRMLNCESFSAAFLGTAEKTLPHVDFGGHVVAHGGVLYILCGMSKAATGNEPRATAPLPPDVQARLREMAAKVGDVELGEMLGIGRGTVSRAAAGFAVRPSVATTIALRLEAAEKG